VPLPARTGKADPALDRIVRKALAHDPAARFPTAEAFAEELRALQEPVVVSGGDPQAADAARALAFQAAEDARRAGAEKLANAVLSEATQRFRDGEAHEHLKQYAAAARRYEAAAALFHDAQARAQAAMEKVLALKAAQRDMESARAEAERCGAPELVAGAFAQAAAEDAAARTTQAITEATRRYGVARASYEHAAERARKHGEALLVEPRRAVQAIRERTLHLGLDAYAPDEMAVAEAALAEAEARRDDVKQARTLFAAARARFEEAARTGLERKQREVDLAGRPPITIAGIDLVWITPGSFTMGSDEGDPDEAPPHEVTVSDGFWMARTPITQGVWTAVMGENPSGFHGPPELPVENVTWFDCQAFVRRLNEQHGGGFRLCSEAEWEYACRAGGTTRWCFGNDESQLDAYAWHPGNAGGRTHPVGAKRPNAWGLHDMHGNVCEWCDDDHTPGYGDAAAAMVDPAGKVTRGGSWCVVASDCRSACRSWAPDPGSRYDFVGFRVCRAR